MSTSWKHYRRRPADMVVRRLRRRPERIVTAARWVRRRPPSPPVILTTSFALAIVVGTVVLMLPIASAGGQWTSPQIALFTATSAVTLTGLVVVDTATYWSPVGQGLILLLIQLGGLGFVTGASLIFVLLGRRLTLHQRLLLREATGAFTISEVAHLARRIMLTMFAFEAAGAVLLFLAFVTTQPPGRALWWALFHAVSAFNNAGFDVMGEFRSLTAYQSDSLILLTMSALIIVGGLSYLTLADIYRKRTFLRLSLDSKIVLLTSLALWTVGTVFVLGAEWRNQATLGPLSWPEKLLNAYFQAVTARSAGFNAIEIAGLQDQTLFLTMILMFIGAASASTGGGIRVNTFSVLLVAIIATLLGRRWVHLFRRTIPLELVGRALSVALLSLAFVFGMTYLLMTTESESFLQLMFEVTSAFGNVGLSTGITPRLSLPGSLLIAATMFVGRLGPLTLALILAAAVSGPPRIQYAEEAVRVG